MVITNTQKKELVKINKYFIIKNKFRKKNNKKPFYKNKRKHKQFFFHKKRQKGRRRRRFHTYNKRIEGVINRRIQHPDLKPRFLQTENLLIRGGLLDGGLSITVRPKFFYYRRFNFYTSRFSSYELSFNRFPRMFLINKSFRARLLSRFLSNQRKRRSGKGIFFVRRAKKRFYTRVRRKFKFLLRKRLLNRLVARRYNMVRRSRTGGLLYFLGRRYLYDLKTRFVSVLRRIFGISLKRLSLFFSAYYGYSLNSLLMFLPVEIFEDFHKKLRFLMLNYELKKYYRSNVKTKIKYGIYSGYRISIGLPARGQRSKTNAQTAKKLRRALVETNAGRDRKRKRR